MAELQQQQQQQKSLLSTAKIDGNSLSDGGIMSILWGPVRAVQAILRDGVHPEHIYQFHLRNYMRLLGLWPARWDVENRSYYIYNVSIMFLMHLFVGSIFGGLYNLTDDAVQFAENFVMALGFSLILFKLWFVRFNTNNLEAIMDEFDAFHTLYARQPWQLHHEPMRRCQRKFYLAEFIVHFGFTIVVTLQCCAMCLHPLYSGDGNALPFRALFPSYFTDRAKHPYAYVLLYIFQTLSFEYLVVAIVLTDTLGTHSICQVAVNLRILCLRLRQLGSNNRQRATKLPPNYCATPPDLRSNLRTIFQFHQRIISIKDRVNDIYYWNYVAQMSASTFLICLCAFEIVQSHDQPLVALKYFFCMLSVFSQLSYWCFVGNFTYFDSLEVARAVFEVQDWYDQHREFQRDLMFMLQRAQKPLEFCPRPFTAFNFETFSNILRASYTYLTLLLTMTD